MSTDFSFFPESASTIAPRVDAVYLFILGITVFFTLLIAGLILSFGIYYRRGSKASRENPPTSIWLEITWSVIPLIIVMGMFFWGAEVFVDMRTMPAGAMEIEVVGKQWMWKVQHSSGRAEINTLHVPTGQPIKLRMISEDVIHSYYIPAFRVKQDVLPGYYTDLWFEATKPGTYHLFCAEYCGTEHSLMRGTVTVMDPDEFAQWTAQESRTLPTAAGKELFERFRCGSCHKGAGGGPGPALAGVYGSLVPLKGGGAVVANEQYLRDSILDPPKQVVAGFEPVMPSFKTLLSEAEVLQLIAYLKSLSVAE